MELYADIVLPVARDCFTFAVGEALRNDLREGQCVKVQLGKSKYYMGVVWRLHGERPPYRVIKTVDEYVAHGPVLSVERKRFWEWIAQYYMCTLGEVMKAALPGALKPEGFSHEEFAREVYRPPVMRLIALHPSIADSATLNEAFETLRRAPKQYNALIDIIDRLGEDFTAEIPRMAVAAESVVLSALQKKKIITLIDRELHSGELPPLSATLPHLSPVQQAAHDTIKEQFMRKDVVLLHGVTGSGKTEIYINLIGEQLRAGHNVLYLLPEIAMTAQLIERVRRWFGERVITYHSKFSDRHRVEAYRRVDRSRGGEVILGVRSALFLPVDNLGLVVVDEEHDQSYKQADVSPRYHARDAAIVLARQLGAKVLLGSATPSIESWVNAAEGKYGLATLMERWGGVQMPEMIVSDTLRAVKRGERTSHFNKELLDRLADVLARGRQAMLFQNRRGFSPYVECGECGATVICPRCNVTLTWHKSDGQLRCHYCGHTRRPPQTCPSCGTGAMETRGFGTEKVGEELAHLFPEARTDRLDRDTAATERRYREIIASFERGETDVLVGTQMITKGFDFDGVALVGVLNADNLLSYPDFRASERAFQLLTQVAGRAGRRDERGEVIIQTAQPTLPLIRQIAAGDYEGMVRTQLADRADFFYPPYCRLVEITMRHRNRELLWDAANCLAVDGRAIFGSRLLGPQPPLVDRIRGEYLLSFLLKVERSQSFARAKEALAEAIARLNSEQKYKYIRVTCNVDPQ